MAFHDVMFEMIVDVFSNTDAIILEYNTLYINIYIYIYYIILFMRFLYVFQDTRTYIKVLYLQYPRELPGAPSDPRCSRCGSGSSSKKAKDPLRVEDLMVCY